MYIYVWIYHWYELSTLCMWLPSPPVGLEGIATAYHRYAMQVVVYRDTLLVLSSGENMQYVDSMQVVHK